MRPVAAVVPVRGRMSDTLRLGGGQRQAVYGRVGCATRRPFQGVPAPRRRPGRSGLRRAEAEVVENLVDCQLVGDLGNDLQRSPALAVLRSILLYLTDRSFEQGRLIFVSRRQSITFTCDRNSGILRV